MDAALKSHFLSPERLDSQQLANTIREVCHNPIVTQLMKSLKAGVIVLNDHRQIIAANDEAAEIIDGGDIERVLGLRPGESIGCIHASNTTGGCGTQPACRSCGAIGAILESREQNAATHRKCTISIQQSDGTPDTIELDVHAAPLPLSEQTFTLVTLFDIREEKRREALERSFFHDIVNTIGGLSGLCQIMETAGGATDPTLFAMAKRTAEYLAEAVYSQRDLLAMEDGRYETQRFSVSPSAVLEKVKSLISMSGLLHNKHLHVENRAPNMMLKTDPTLLIRVIINMIKNALEAIEADEVVTVVFSAKEDTARFEVFNTGNIPEEATYRIFEKHYSTKKGTGRGIGTFGMKLLGEQYLGGKVDFETGDGRTRFFIALPLDNNNDPPR